ncbi:transcriptional regulator GutM [Thalassobacillus sp. C254]|uniref:transcriptional regulator GutM n=1 Tax=Thalassobacillus sp. C254 TaxID=1225341 RepID=UPI0009F9AB5B|nr:transcriptional regulator GutM [Thalassobacillus sp. C254]
MITSGGEVENNKLYIIILIGGAWLLQSLLGFLQIKHFNKHFLAHTPPFGILLYQCYSLFIETS